MYSYFSDQAYQADQIDQDDQVDQDDQADQADQIDQDDQADQADQVDQFYQINQIDQGSSKYDAYSGILTPQEPVDIQYTPNAQKSKYDYRISKHRRHSHDERPYKKCRKSKITSKYNQKDSMKINPSNYVRKNQITQSYSLISQQNFLDSLSLSSNSSPKMMEHSNEIDSSNTPVMTKTYEIHPNGQFGFRQISDRYIDPLKDTVEISINNEQFNITRPEVIREICAALDNIFQKNLSKDEFRTIELNSITITSHGQYQE